MTEEVTIGIEEYTKLISERNGYEVGFIITISILVGIIFALLICAYIKFTLKDNN